MGIDTMGPGEKAAKSEVKIDTMGFRGGQWVSVMRSSGEIEEEEWVVLDFKIHKGETWAVVGKPGSNSDRASFYHNYQKGVKNEDDIGKQLPVRELQQVKSLVEARRQDSILASDKKRFAEEDERRARGPERKSLSETEQLLIANISIELATAKTKRQLVESLKKIKERLKQENDKTGQIEQEVLRMGGGQVGNDFSAQTEEAVYKFALRKNGQRYSLMPSDNLLEGLKVLNEADK